LWWRGIIARDLVTGEIERHSHAVVIASGGYGNVFFITYAMGNAMLL
jgi:succinate dehydrogenase / fumarate reductase flavoprotein subunit